MTDLREKVADDRRFLKKLELAIPGFRGYRKREDRRIADSLLRNQLADAIKECTVIAIEIREELASQMELGLIREAGTLVNLLDSTESKVRHADQGYSGISADIQTLESEIERIYEFDYSLLEGVKKMKMMLMSAKENVDMGDMNSLRVQMKGIREEIKTFNNYFSKRTEVITRTGAFA